MTIAVILPQGEELKKWEGYCLELVNELLHRHPTGQILYIEPWAGPWKYHTALVLDGLVYDAWYPDVRLPPAEYVEEVFGDVIEWEIIPEGESRRVIMKKTMSLLSGR